MTMERHCTMHANLWNTNARTHRAGQTAHKRFHLLLHEDTRHILAPKTTKKEPTHNNEAADDHIMDPETKTKTYTHANKNKLEHT